jgi:hypothetical protein
MEHIKRIEKPSTFMIPGEGVWQYVLNTRSLSLSCSVDPFSTYVWQFTKYNGPVIHYLMNAPLDLPNIFLRASDKTTSWLCCRYKSGQNHLTEFIGVEPSKKRKRRTSFTPQALELLNAHFERNTHPSGKDI